MLSYRHAFHAGNHADVLKHAVLAYCLSYLAKKPKPLCYIDTHAGAGIYKLDSPQALKTGEAHNGIKKLLATRPRPALLNDFLLSIETLMGPGENLYPGSPAIAARLLSNQQRLVLYEMHCADAEALQKYFLRQARVSISDEDGFKGLIARLPPPERRALVLIDPSYELKQDYDDVVEVLQQAVKRFATGTYLLWYPVITRPAVKRLEQSLRQSLQRPCLLAEWSILPDSPGHGMTGSGMLVVNPPWGLEAALAEALPWMTAHLAEAGRGSHRLLQWQAAETHREP